MNSDNTERVVKHIGSSSNLVKRQSTHMVPDLRLERDLASCGFDLIVGFDEVGRGALAGPVMVGASAMWARDVASAQVPTGLADSKLLTPHQREVLYKPLQDWCSASAVGRASNREIDEWGISHALGVAALRALDDLERGFGMGCHDVDVNDGANGSGRIAGSVTIGAILDGPNDYISKASGTFDAPEVPRLPHVTTRVKADQSCALVSAASVIAKVTRDRLMTSLALSDPKYAPYAWERNKGYGSAAHRRAIREFGPSDLHRVTWHLV